MLVLSTYYEGDRCIYRAESTTKGSTREGAMKSENMADVKEQHLGYKFRLPQPC